MKLRALLTIFHLLLMTGCQEPGDPSSDISEDPGLGRFIVLHGTVRDITTGEVVHGWKITVDHGLMGYSGPPLRDHFSQERDDVTGVFYLCAAPSIYANEDFPERMGITIEREFPDATYYSATFFVSKEMWRDGRWRRPRMTFQNPGPADEEPRYELRLELSPQVHTKLDEDQAYHHEDLNGRHESNSIKPTTEE